MINVVKSSQPSSDFKYTDHEIKSVIKSDFHEMCFLCEEVALRHSEIEHFYPVKGGWPEKEHEWDNLLWCCEKCNKIKSNSYNRKAENGNIEKEILKSWVDNVENTLKLSIDFSTHEVFFNFEGTDSRIANTVELLDKIYNGKGTSSLSYIDLRKMIIEELAEFLSLVESYLNAEKPAWYKEIQETDIKVRLSKTNKNAKSSFVSFKRWYILDKENLRQDFQRHFD
jgi:uncharacterized protein (TIGR02646 family)